MKAFLSYTQTAKLVAGLFKDELEGYGVDAFLAHEDISPSIEWQQKILEALEECDLFFPLLTKDFIESKWTDQECGIAVGLKKTIVPIKIDTDPYGFIGRYQAIRLSDTFPVWSCCEEIFKTLVKKPGLDVPLRDSMISAFVKSGSWSASSRNSKRLALLEPFSPDQLNTIVEGSAANYEIYQGFDARAYVERLIEENGKKISSASVKSFLEKIA